MPVPRSGAVRRHSGGTAYAGRNGRLRLRQCPVLSQRGNPGGLGMLHGGRNVALLRTPAFRRRFRHRFRISATGILVSSESDRRGPGQIPMVHAPRQVADAADRLAAAHLPVQKPDARLSRCGSLLLLQHLLDIHQRRGGKFVSGTGQRSLAGRVRIQSGPRQPLGVRSGGRRRYRRTGEATGIQRSGALLLRLFGPAAQPQQIRGKFDGRKRESVSADAPPIPAR